MSVVFDVEGIVIGERAKLEQIAQQYLNDQEAKEMNYSLEAKINEEGNLEFKAQGVGRNFHTPDVENVIERYLDNEVECYKLWGTTDGTWVQYTNDTEGRFYKQWYVDDYTHGAKKVFFDDYDEAKAYAMNIIKNNPGYVEGLEESGMDEEEYFEENFLAYLELNQVPVQIVNITRVNPEDVVNTDMYNEDIPTTEKGNYKGKYQNLVIPMGFHDKIVDVEYFFPENLRLLDDDSTICFIEDSMSGMDWYPEITGYLVRFVEEQNFKIEKGKSIGMIFENLEDAQAKLAWMENNFSFSSEPQHNDDLLNSLHIENNQEVEFSLPPGVVPVDDDFNVEQYNVSQRYLMNANDINSIISILRFVAEADYSEIKVKNCEEVTIPGDMLVTLTDMPNNGLLFLYGLSNLPEDCYPLLIEGIKSNKVNVRISEDNSIPYYLKQFTMILCLEKDESLPECLSDIDFQICDIDDFKESSLPPGVEPVDDNQDGFFAPPPGAEVVNDLSNLEDDKEKYERADWAFTIGYGIFNEGNPEKESDYKEAYDLFSEAAELGYAEAMAYMGVMYRNGFVVEKDDAKAAEWYQKAIDTGGKTLLTSLAYNNLGILYQRGEGVEQDYVKARDLFQKAVNVDHNDRAQQHLDEMNQLLNT